MIANTTITAEQDGLDEHAESVIVDIDTVTNGVEDGSQQVMTSILDDDSEPTVTLGIDPAMIVENGGVATVTATLAQLSGKDVTVDLAFSGTAAGGGTDYSAASQIVIPAGSLSASMTITAEQDGLDEHAESVIVDIDTVTNGVEDGSQQVMTSILDDDPEPTVTLGIDTATILENGGVATLSATLSESSGRDVVVDLVYSGAAVGGGTDYNAASQIVIPAGSLSANTTITAEQDGLDEHAESVIVDIDTVTNGVERMARNRS